jgi:imidazolonepropionase-like amidohydrolase
MAATAWAADLLKLRAGRLEPGCLADAALFARDPLADLETLTDPAAIGTVIADGRLARLEPWIVEERNE